MIHTFLYIDPGTGSMLFSLFIGFATAGIFALRALILKLKFLFSGGKIKTKEKNISTFVIYSDHKRYWNIFKPICDEFEQRKIDLIYLTQSYDDPVFSLCKNPNGYKHIKADFIGEGNKGFARLNILKADIVLSTTPGLDVLQWKRSRDVKFYIHIPHMVNDISTYRMFALDFYDAILVTGNNQKKEIRILEQLRKEKEKEIIVVGCPYFDQMKKRIKESNLKNTKDIKVLVAPSWGKSSLLNLYGEKLISALLNTGLNIVIRPHPQSFTAEKSLLENLQNKYSNIEWNTDNDNFKILNESDILITDFSGIIFDYTMIFNKPLIYTKPETFDKAPYDAAWINDDLWTFKVLSKLGIELQESDFPKLKSIIESAIKDDTLSKNREEIRSDCWAEVGNSAENVVNYLECKQQELN